MISKNKQSKLAGFRILLAIPTAFALMVLFSFTTLENSTNVLKDNTLQPTIQAVKSSLDNSQNPQVKPVTQKPVKETIKFTPPKIVKQPTAVKKIIKFTPPVIAPDEKPLNKVEQDPEFKGGNEAMFKFMSSNMKYPEKAKKAGIQGTVFVQFVVDKTGTIYNVKILRGIGGDCDEEALRVVKSMPNWIPGKQDGKDVAVIFQIPVKFQLASTVTKE